MEGMSLDQLILEVISSSTQDGDFVVYKRRVKVLLENLVLKFDQDNDYQRDLEEQIDSLEVENMGKDKCIKRLSRDAREAIDECKCEADEMAGKMMATVKQLQADNALYQEKFRIAVAETEALKLRRLAELQAITAVTTVFERNLNHLQGKFSDVTLRLELAEKRNNNDTSEAERSNSSHNSESGGISNQSNNDSNSSKDNNTTVSSGTNGKQAKNGDKDINDVSNTDTNGNDDKNGENDYTNNGNNNGNNNGDNDGDKNNNHNGDKNGDKSDKSISLTNVINVDKNGKNENTEHSPTKIGIKN